MNRKDVGWMYILRFFRVLSPEFLENLQRVDSYPGELQSIIFRFTKDLDQRMLCEILRSACFSVFPREILSKGILIDDRTDGCVEIRFGVAEEEWQIIAKAHRKALDIN